MSGRRPRAFATAVVVSTFLVAADAHAAATVVVVNTNAPGVGFNDPAPRAPVGGNTGTTLGQQRLIAFQFAAARWGQTLDSPVPIVVDGAFVSQTCTASGAVLGSATTAFIFANFPHAGLAPGPVGPNLWHSSALADKRAGGELHPGFPDIVARFNANLNGSASCLGGRQFYLGLDANHGTDLDLVTVLLHEFAHGMGFQQFASVTTGARPLNFDDVFNVHIFDNRMQKSWPQMTNAERAASAINARNVVFTGAETAANVSSVLTAGTPLLTVESPAAAAGIYQVGAAQFGAALASPGVAGQIVLAIDPADAAGPLTTDGCAAFTNAEAIAGKIALVDRGTCGFVVKAKNAQNAGAIAAIIADNVPDAPPAGMAGVDPTVTIPAVRISQADGNRLKVAIAAGSVSGSVGVNPAVLSGADAAGFPLLYTPVPATASSTISHWDTVAFPNQLMEPFFNDDLTHSLQPPQDLTLPVLRDIGWFRDTDVDGLADTLDACPASNFESTVSIEDENTGVSNVLFTSGCTISDLVANAAADARNHGGFVSGVAHLSDALRDAGIITNQERSRMQRAAAHSSLP